MAINGSGIRDTARVLRISPTTVIAVLKKSRRASPRQPRVTAPSLFTRFFSVPVERAAELDEMWSFVGAKERPIEGCGMRSIIAQEECSPT